VKLTVVCIGRLKSGPERELAERYRERAEAVGRSKGLSPVEIVELAESRARRDADRRAEEGRMILEHSGTGILVAFDERGRTLTSEALAKRLETWRDGGAAAVNFAIGGADGLDEAVRDTAALILSFGAMTLPHQLVRVIVLEQIYRCLTILAGHPYHRGG
jgi:23S rRNA (pseudouridine1915-N3)-methyltransferase